MKLTINIEKRFIFVFTFFLVLVAGIFIVRSYDSAQGWHPSSQIDFSQGLNVLQGGGSMFAGDDGNNPRIELRATDGSGNPYFDFSNDATTDFDGRLILTNNDQLEVNGAKLKVSYDVSGDNSLEVYNGNTLSASKSKLVLSDEDGLAEFVTGEGNDLAVMNRKSGGSIVFYTTQGSTTSNKLNIFADDYKGIYVRGKIQIENPGVIDYLGPCDSSTVGSIDYVEASGIGHFYGCTRTSGGLWWRQLEA